MKLHKLIGVFIVVFCALFNVSVSSAEDTPVDTHTDVEVEALNFEVNAEDSEVEIFEINLQDEENENQATSTGDYDFEIENINLMIDDEVFEPNPEEPQEPIVEQEKEKNDGKHRDGTRRRSRGSVLGVSSSTEGEVLGASVCTDSINTYMKQGAQNNSEEVKKLQNFLNKEMNTNLEINGLYDQATVDVVKAFQLKYADKILKPWGINEPTGYAYKLTIWWANAIICGNEDTAVMPSI